MRLWSKSVPTCVEAESTDGRNVRKFMTGKVMSSDSLIESDWKLDGFPCGTFERQNEDGKWVE